LVQRKAGLPDREKMDKQPYGAGSMDRALFIPHYFSCARLQFKLRQSGNRQPSPNWLDHYFQDWKREVLVAEVWAVHPRHHLGYFAFQNY